MTLQVLVEYYEAFEWEERITSLGWYRAKIAYGLDTSEQGELKSAIPLKQERQKGKETVTVSQSLMVPQMVSRSSGVSTNFPYDHPGYMLGIDNKGEPEWSRECFKCAEKKHKDISEHISSPAVRAVCRFFDCWTPDQTAENPCLAPELREIIPGSNLMLMMDRKYVHGDSGIRQYWEEYNHQSGTGSMDVCLMTGRREETARTHGTIKGVQRAQSSGAALVSSSAPAFESYGKEQSFNAPVGTYAAYTYTMVFSYLLGDRIHGTTIGDTVVVYWSEEGDERHQSIFACISEPIIENQEIVDGVSKSLTEGKAVVVQDIQNSLDMGRKFYVLGPAPSAARLVMRPFYQDGFENILKHIKEHYDRMEIVRPTADAMEYLGVRRMLQETVSKKFRDKKSAPSMFGAVYRAIISGSRYPAPLYQTVLGRIRVEQDDGDSRIHRTTRGKAAIIKIYLLKNGNEKEEMTMALDEDSNNIAYILGREFTALEVIQEDVNPGINAIIKDKCFNSACTTPAAIFPILFRLKNSHIKKMNSGAEEICYEKVLGDLQGGLTAAEGQKTACPGQLTLEEQEMFILGYYRQTQKKYEKKMEKEA